MIPYTPMEQENVTEEEDIDLLTIGTLEHQRPVTQSTRVQGTAYIRKIMIQ